MGAEAPFCYSEDLMSKFKNPIRVIVKNYQSIEYIDIVVEGYTTIKGESGIGKSALTRSIRDALNNTFKKSAMRHFQEEVYVMLHFLAFDFKIEWFRTLKTSSYIINGKPYESLNGAVPQPIIDFGLGAFYTQDRKHSYFPQLCSSQHNTHFFIFDSDRYKAELLSEISGTTDVVTARRLAHKELKEYKAVLKSKEKEFKDLLDKGKCIEDVDLKLVESSVEKQLDLVDSLVKTYNLKEKQLQEYTFAEKQLQILDMSSYKVVSLDGIADSLQSIGTSISLLEEYNKAHSISSNASLLDGLVDVEVTVDDYLQGKIDTLISYEEAISSLETLSLLDEIKDTKVDYHDRLLLFGNNIDNYQNYVTFASSYMDEIPPLRGLPDLDRLPVLDNLLDCYLGYCENVTEDVKPLINSIRLVDFSEITDRLSNLNQKFEWYEEYIRLLGENTSLQGSIGDLEKEIEGIKSELDGFDTCPLCRSPLEKGHFHA